MFRIHRKQQKCISKSSLNICVVKIIQGGGVAAPIGAQIFGEVLPYLELEKDNIVEGEETTTIEVPNVIGLSISDADKVLKDSGLIMQIEEIEGLDKKNTLIKSQTPNSKVIVNSGSNVYLEY